MSEPILTLRGTVCRGNGVANPLYETPTANLFLPEPLTIEGGVYAAHVYYNEDEFEAIAVYQDGIPKFEVHLFDFDGDLYGKELKVELLRKVSEIVPWVTVERMRQKILHDIELVHGYFALSNDSP